MKNRRRPLRRSALIQAMQSLEPRQLMSFSVAPNSAVVMSTSLGEVTVQLDNDVPITTANFLTYVAAGEYNGTFFHRTTSPNDANQDSFSVVQGGGFTTANPSQAITNLTNPPTGITNEFTDEHPNVAGTIAMARTSGLDSATSQFFFNVSDNSSAFNDSNPFAVFGNVIRGEGVVQAIDNLTTQDLSTTDNNGALTTVPVTSTGNLVSINTATEEDTMTVNIGPNDAQGDRSVTFMDPTTKAVTNIAISGGDATIIFTGTGMKATQRGSNLLITGTNLDLQQIASTDSTAKTNLNINASGGQGYVNVGDIDITGSINSINGGKVNLTGDINVSGGIKTIKLLASTAAGAIDLDTSGADASTLPATIINIPFLSDISIESNANIQQLIARQYSVNDGTNRGVSAPAINQVHIFGTMNATLEAGLITAVNVGTLTGLVEANSITNVSLDTMTGGILFAAGAFDANTLGITRVSVKGAMSSNAQIVAAGNIGSVQVGSMSNSDIFAGIDTSDLQSGGFPTALASNATLNSVSVKTNKKSTTFSNSQIGSFQINALHLGRISTNSSSGTTTGVQAHLIKSLSATTDKNQSLHLSNINSPAALNTALIKSGVNLNPGVSIGTLATALATGQTFTSIKLKTGISSALTAGATISLVSAGKTQTLTLSAAASSAATTLSVNSFVANATYPIGANVTQPGTGFTIDMI